MVRTIPKKGTKMSGYEHYLFYKKILGIIEEGGKSREDVAIAMGMKTPAIWHPLRVLLDNGAIKVASYEVVNCSKKQILGLVNK